jgi:hypothetical protein
MLLLHCQHSGIISNLNGLPLNVRCKPNNKVEIKLKKPLPSEAVQKLLDALGLWFIDLKIVQLEQIPDD